MISMSCDLPPTPRRGDVAKVNNDDGKRDEGQRQGEDNF